MDEERSEKSERNVGKIPDMIRVYTTEISVLLIGNTKESKWLCQSKSMINSTYNSWPYLYTLQRKSNNYNSLKEVPSVLLYSEHCYDSWWDDLWPCPLFIRLNLRTYINLSPRMKLREKRRTTQYKAIPFNTFLRILLWNWLARPRERQRY